MEWKSNLIAWYESPWKGKVQLRNPHHEYHLLEVSDINMQFHVLLCKCSSKKLQVATVPSCSLTSVIIALCCLILFSSSSQLIT